MERKRWTDWAVELRQQMMTGLTPQVTKSVQEISEEVNTTKAEKTMRSERFWRSCQDGKTPNDFLAKAGFDIEFELDENSKVQDVTMRLDQSWLAIMQRVLDRAKK